MSTSAIKRLMFLGAPGVGKGTYAARVAPQLNIPTISTGELVREEIKQGTDLGMKIQEYSNTGKLVPDDIVLSMVKARLSKDDCKTKGFLLDGFPRNTYQAEQLEKFAPLDMVLNISLAEWVLLDKILGRRMCGDCGAGYNVANIDTAEYQMPPLLPREEGICDHCGGTKFEKRVDDTKEIILQRIEIYKEETLPLIKFYTDLGILSTFNVKKGLGDIDALTDCVIEGLSKHKSKL